MGFELRERLDEQPFNKKLRKLTIRRLVFGKPAMMGSA
jgi:hypothetical protein